MQAWDSSGVCQWLTVWQDRRRGQQLTRWRASAHLFVLCFPILFFVWISGLMCRFLLLFTFGLQRPLVSHFPRIITFRPFCIDGHTSFKLTLYYYFNINQSYITSFFPSPCKFSPNWILTCLLEPKAFFFYNSVAPSILSISSIILPFFPLSTEFSSSFLTVR